MDWTMPPAGPGFTEKIDVFLKRMRGYPECQKLSGVDDLQFEIDMMKVPSSDDHDIPLNLDEEAEDKAIKRTIPKIDNQHPALEKMEELCEEMEEHVRNQIKRGGLFH